MTQETLKLYKFRSLNTSSGGRCWAKEIVETGEFYHSKFWDQNDPMEGIYQYNAKSNDQPSLDEIFADKASRLLCCFSGERAFQNPAVWGYYTNGFRGAAIEIEVAASAVNRIKYSHKLFEWKGPSSLSARKQLADRILTTKLRPWYHENEYRSLWDGHEAKAIRVGVITGIYFGSPYEKEGASGGAAAQSKHIGPYRLARSHLIEIAKAKSIPSYSVEIEGTKVVRGTLL